MLYFRLKFLSVNKSLITVVILGFTIIALQAFNTNPQPKYQNLQILPQNISEKGLDSVMHHFTNSLGVKCSYCHVRNTETKKMDFASDAKPEKQIARKMMLMAIDINKNHFSQIEEEMHDSIVQPKDTAAVGYMLKYVTCYTCHHGNPHPVNDPPKEDEKQ